MEKPVNPDPVASIAAALDTLITGSRSWSEAADRVGVTARTLRKLADATGVSAEPTRSHDMRWTDQRIREALTAAQHDIGETVTFTRYVEWQKHDNNRGPSPALLMLRNRNAGRTWKQMLRSYRLRHSGIVEHRVGDAQVTADAASTAIREFIEECDAGYMSCTATNYQRWATRRGKPSRITVQTRFGVTKWSELVAVCRTNAA